MSDAVEWLEANRFSTYYQQYIACWQNFWGHSLVELRDDHEFHGECCLVCGEGGS